MTLETKFELKKKSNNSKLRKIMKIRKKTRNETELLKKKYNYPQNLNMNFSKKKFKKPANWKVGNFVKSCLSAPYCFANFSISS